MRNAIFNLIVEAIRVKISVGNFIDTDLICSFFGQTFIYDSLKKIGWEGDSLSMSCSLQSQLILLYAAQHRIGNQWLIAISLE